MLGLLPGAAAAYGIYKAGSYAADKAGINKDSLLGGAGASTNPADYAVPFQDRSQIMGAITPGLATQHTAQTVDPYGGAFRQSQIGQLQQLQGIASGQQQGAGELAAQRQTQNALAGQQAMARMARGGNAALAYRGSADRSAGIGLAGAGMAQQAALGDQTAAQGMMAQVAGQGRGQDSQIQLANMDAQLRAAGMTDQARLGYLSQLTGMNAAQLDAQTKAMAAATGQPGMLGPLLSTGGQLLGGAMMMSDERVKEDIKDAGSEVDEMLDALLPKAYVYKDQSKHGIGRRVGIMAQDLRKSKAGADVTVDTDDGIALDVNKAISAALASSARLNKRVRELERKAG